MAAHRSGDPWSGTTYNGFSGMGHGPANAATAGSAGDVPRPDGRSRPPPRKGLVLAGVGGALALGLAFGLLSRPDFGEDGRSRPAAPQSSAAPEAAGAPDPAVPIVVAPQPASPTTPAPPAGKLEVLPPELARAAGSAPAVRAAAPPPPPVRTAPAEPRREPAPAPVPAPRLEPRPAEPPPRIAAAPSPGPSYNCRYAGTRAERMICGDAELARLDRRLSQAFNRAVASGVPYRELRAEQDDWLGIREDAARRSPEAVASIYRQRIAELNDLAE